MLIFFKVTEETININLAYRTILATAAKSAFVSIFFCIINSSLIAAVCTTTADNTWDCGTPTSSDDLIVNHTITITGDFNLSGSITVNSGGHLTINGNVNATVGIITVNNGGSLTIHGDVILNANCILVVDGDALFNKTLTVKNSASVSINGALIVQGFTVFEEGGSLDISVNGTLTTNNNLTFNSNLITVDGNVAVNGSFTNNKNISGDGAINYTNQCLGAGTINGFASADYCGSGNIDLNALDCSTTDTIEPVFDTFPTNQTVFVSADNCNSAVSWSIPTVSDNCGIPNLVSTANPGDVFPLGVSTVSYTVTDIAGYVTQQSFTITVLDTISPRFISFPSDQTVSTDANSCTAVVNWINPEAADNCTISSIISSHNSGDVFSAGVTEVVYTVTDASGNSTQDSFFVTVEDNSPPALISFPTNISAKADKNSCSATVSWPEPEVQDNCTDIMITSNYQSGDPFPQGITEVIYTISDAAGNSTSQSFMVTVQDQTPPIFITCPENYTLVSTDSLRNTSVITWEEPAVEDNCSEVTLESNFQPGDDFTMGISEVIYTATDEAGNTATCTFNVEVYINLPPTANNISEYTKAGEAIDICLNASDPNNDIISIKETRHENNLASITNIDLNELCFLYTADIDFYGRDTVFVVLQDNGIPAKTTTVSVIVEVERNVDIDINDVLTINGDMINDSWLIKNIDQYPNNYVKVFDRWGGLIFQVSGYDNNTKVWNGESNGSILRGDRYVSTGTYFYMIDLGNGTSRLTGAIEVIR